MRVTMKFKSHPPVRANSSPRRLGRSRGIQQQHRRLWHPIGRAVTDESCHWSTGRSTCLTICSTQGELLRWARHGWRQHRASTRPARRRRASQCARAGWRDSGRIPQERVGWQWTGPQVRGRQGAPGGGNAAKCRGWRHWRHKSAPATGSAGLRAQRGA